RIYNIPSTAGSTGTLIGINFAGASGTAANVTLVNNFVSIVPQFTNAQVVKGIQDNGLSGNTFTADFNSVYIGGTGSSTSGTWAACSGRQLNCQHGFYLYHRLFLC